MIQTSLLDISFLTITGLTPLESSNNQTVSSSSKQFIKVARAQFWQLSPNTKIKLQFKIISKKLEISKLSLLNVKLKWPLANLKINDNLNKILKISIGSLHGILSISKPNLFESNYTLHVAAAATEENCATVFYM